MKVLRVHGPGDLRLASEPVPVVPKGWEMVRVRAVGICGSDLHWLEDGYIGKDYLETPLVLGHEFAGVVATGSGEQLMAVDPAIPCGSCDRCLEGNPNLCGMVRFAGHAGDDGALRTCMPWPSSCLHPLPEGMTAADGAMLEPLGVAMHAVDLGRVSPGMCVGVFGCGPIGLLIVQVARVAGATTIVATDLLDHRLDAARRCGADLTYEAAGGAEVDEIMRTVEDGVDVAFEAAGTSEAVHTAIELARAGGRVVLVGIPGTDTTSFRASTVRRKGLTVQWSRRMKHTYPRAVALVRSGRIDVRTIVSHAFSLDDHRTAFGVALRREGLKVVIVP